MKWLKIDGREYNVSVLGISETATIAYTVNTGQTVNGRTILDPIGTSYGHAVTVGRKKGDVNELDKLYDYVTKPRFDAMRVDAVHGQDTINYEAYISTPITRVVKKIDDANEIVYYDAFDIVFTPIEAQVKPI